MVAGGQRAAWMLVRHSIRAGHLGHSLDRDRARLLLDEVTRPGIWHPDRSSGNVALHLPEIGSHASVASRYVEEIYYAWQDREAIGLSRARVARMVAILGDKAESAYHQEDWGNQENACRYSNAIGLAYEVT